MVGLTQIDAAAKLGIAQSSLSDLERQRFGGTTIQTARKFAELYGCAIEDLYPASAAVSA